MHSAIEVRTPVQEQQYPTRSDRRPISTALVVSVSCGDGAYESAVYVYPGVPLVSMGKTVWKRNLRKAHKLSNWRFVSGRYIRIASDLRRESQSFDHRGENDLA